MTALKTKLKDMIANKALWLTLFFLVVSVFLFAYTYPMFLSMLNDFSFAIPNVFVYTIVFISAIIFWAFMHETFGHWLTAKIQHQPNLQLGVSPLFFFVTPQMKFTKKNRFKNFLTIINGPLLTILLQLIVFSIVTYFMFTNFVMSMWIPYMYFVSFIFIGLILNIYNLAPIFFGTDGFVALKLYIGHKRTTFASTAFLFASLAVLYFTIYSANIFPFILTSIMCIAMYVIYYKYGNKIFAFKLSHKKGWHVLRMNLKYKNKIIRIPIGKYYTLRDY